MAMQDVMLLQRVRLAPDSPAVRLTFPGKGNAPAEQTIRTGRLSIDAIQIVEAPSRKAVVDWLGTLSCHDGPVCLEVRESGCPGGLPGVDTGTVASLPRYVVLVGADAQTEADASPASDRLDAMARCNDEAVRSGLLLAADGLKSTRQGSRWNVNTAGRISVLDGPFAEAKELVAGFWLIQAVSLGDAVAWARDYPFAQDNADVCVCPALP
jgi:hypothetical protein